ncbi:MAG: DUF493 domain-containing protein [Pseudomonadota bacterium]
MTEPPRIEFPCAYPIKVFVEGDSEDVVAEVLNTVQAHAPDFDISSARFRPSRSGSFLSVSVEITATGEPQLRALHQALMAHERVRLVL